MVPVISRRGKADLRFALYQAALIASVKNPDFIVHYTDKLRGREKEPGISYKIRVKLAAIWLEIPETPFFPPSECRDPQEMDLKKDA